MQHIDGLDFNSAWEASSEQTVDGFTACYISAEHLIQSKLAAGRLRDLADVAALRQAQAALKSKPQ